MQVPEQRGTVYAGGGQHSGLGADLDRGHAVLVPHQRGKVSLHVASAGLPFPNSDTFVPA